jgi:hypothetical protein
MRNLTRWRRDNPVIHDGTLTHFVPVDNVYVYFRHNDDKTVMVILNGDDKEKNLRTGRYSERMAGFMSGVDVLTGEVFTDLGSLTVPAKGSRVIELRR